MAWKYGFKIGDTVVIAKGYKAGMVGRIIASRRKLFSTIIIIEAIQKERIVTYSKFVIKMPVEESLEWTIAINTN